MARRSATFRKRSIARKAQLAKRRGGVRGDAGLRAPADQLAQALLDFPGLPHRMEKIGSVGGIPGHQRQQGDEC